MLHTPDVYLSNAENFQNANMCISRERRLLTNCLGGWQAPDVCISQARVAPSVPMGVNKPYVMLLRCSLFAAASAAQVQPNSAQCKPYALLVRLPAIHGLKSILLAIERQWACLIASFCTHFSRIAPPELPFGGHGRAPGGPKEAPRILEC